MKKNLFHITLLSYTISSPAQISFQSRPLAAPPPSIRWDLSRYVWSHTQSTNPPQDKSVLDFEALDQWKTIGPDEDFSISPNAQYLAYSIQNNQTKARDSLIVQATSDSWRQVFPGATPGFFSSDNKLYVFQDKENLCFLQPGISYIEKISGVIGYRQPRYKKGEWIAYQVADPAQTVVQQSASTLVLYQLPTRKKVQFDNTISYAFDGSDTWLVCQLNNDARELVLHKLQTGEQQRFSSVNAYAIAPNGQYMVMQTTIKEGTVSTTNLQYVNLADKTSKTIWSTADINTLANGFTLDPSGKQVVFMAASSIWYYQAGMENTVQKVNQQTAGIEPGFQIGGPPFFTQDGDYIQFSIQTRPSVLPQPASEAVKVDVWSHKDPILQSTQPWLLKQPPTSYACAIHPDSNRVIRLEQPFERLWHIRGDFALLIKRGQDAMGDRFWEKDYYKDSNWLISLKNGTRTLLKTREGGTTWFSPDGRYIVYFDRDQQCNYFSIKLATGKISNISAGLPAWQLGTDKGMGVYYRQPPGKDRAAGIAAWLEKDQGLLVYDEFYDIWQLDLTGKKPPINVTNGYARQHHIRLRLPAYRLETPVMGAKDTLLLSAFNVQNMQSGFFLKVLGNRMPPGRLFMGDCMLEPLFDFTKANKSLYQRVLKAADTDAWIVKRQRADETPNYQVTTDFKTYKPLTNIQPHKNYNWLTAELHSFKQMDGTTSQGILYKPENFDPAKKYPVIIAFYATTSIRLHEYKMAKYMWSPVAPMDNPGWLTSHGYLIFTPDVYFKKDQWGPGTLNTVEGAARYLRNLPFVDGKHIGACGHSNSGRTGYYVLTHSTAFAAMSIGAGTTNIIETALSTFQPSMNPKESSQLEWAEETSYATGLGSLWQNKASWLDHTSVLHADKASSPVLIFHNKNDGAPVRQAMQMFIALRRLEKKAWWLNYEEGSHTLFKPVDLKDFTIRYTQFFDHYLKGAPAPNWMTNGIPLQLKGIDNGYELDPQGSCGKDCPVCKANSTSKLKK